MVFEENVFKSCKNTENYIKLGVCVYSINRFWVAGEHRRASKPAFLLYLLTIADVNKTFNPFCFFSFTACFPFPLYFSLAENQTGVPSRQQGVGVSEVSISYCRFRCNSGVTVTAVMTVCPSSLCHVFTDTDTSWNIVDPFLGFYKRHPHCFFPLPLVILVVIYAHVCFGML